MSKVTVGRWGKSLAVRLPHDLASRVGLANGERVELEARDGDIVIRRTESRAEARARAAAAVRAIRDLSRGHTLGRVSIRELIDEGRDG